MKEMIQEHPKLRPLMVFPISQPDGGAAICLRDPEGFSDAALMINHATYLMMTLMDGTRDVSGIQADFMRQTQVMIPREQIVDLIGKLHQYLFLDGEGFRLHRKRIEEDFLHASVRPAAHSGTAYPQTAEELSGFLTGFFSALKESAHPDGIVSGIIAPHMDIREAGSCYASAYARLKGSAASTMIILGTAHGSIGENRYSICPKDFETPLGVIPCDQEGIEQIHDAAGVDWTQGQLGHRIEHSVEFQAVFLRYLFPEREIKIIPVLCNSFADLMDRPEGPMYDDSIRLFVETLKAFLARRNGKAALIAGADLSHVGPKFGDSMPLTETDLVSLKTHDLSLIRHVEEGDAEGFFKEIQKERESHNVCGLPNIYTFLKIMEGGKGRLLDYGQFFEPPTSSAVSYASLVF